MNYFLSMCVEDKYSHPFSENKEFVCRCKLGCTILFICLPQLPVALCLDFQLPQAASAGVLEKN